MCKRWKVLDNEPENDNSTTDLGGNFHTRRENARLVFENLSYVVIFCLAAASSEIERHDTRCDGDTSTRVEMLLMARSCREDCHWIDSDERDRYQAFYQEIIPTLPPWQQI